LLLAFSLIAFCIGDLSYLGVFSVINSNFHVINNELVLDFNILIPFFIHNLFLLPIYVSLLYNFLLILLICIFLFIIFIFFIIFICCIDIFFWCFICYRSGLYKKYNC